MRAKFINEKFQEKSDPIQDMGISTRGFLQTEYNRLSKMHNPDIQKDLEIEKYDISNEYHKMYICIIFVKMLEEILKKQTIPNSFHDAYNYWKFHIGYQLRSNGKSDRWPHSSIAMEVCRKILQDKYGVDWNSTRIYEKFSEKGDPLHDMGIGLTQKFNSLRNILNNAKLGTLYWENEEYDKDELTIRYDAFDSISLDGGMVGRDDGRFMNDRGIHDDFRSNYYIDIILPKNEMVRSLGITHQQIPEFDFWNTKILCDNVLDTEDEDLMNMIIDDYDTSLDDDGVFEDALKKALDIINDHEDFYSLNTKK